MHKVDEVIIVTGLKSSTIFKMKCELVIPLFSLFPHTFFTTKKHLLFDSFFFPLLFLRLGETQDVSRSWFVLRFAVHSFLLHHCTLGENHQGGPRHRDQRHTLLLPDDFYSAIPHLPQVSMMEKLRHLGCHSQTVLQSQVGLRCTHVFTPCRNSLFQANNAYAQR